MIGKKLDSEVYFTPKQAAEHFNLSLSTVKNYIYAGKLKTLKTPGGHHRIRRSELLATLGDIGTLKEGIDSFYLARDLCMAVLSVFKAFGSAGNSMIMHARSVSSLSTHIARAMSMSEPDIRRIELAGLLHDIGHIGIERRILLKIGFLTAQEYESMKSHPVIGGEILDSIKELKDAAPIVLQHHERINGAGYPKGLAGEEIDRLARIISITEAYDSMVSIHSYKNPVSKDRAIDELIQQRGAQFDRDMVELFVKTI